MAPGRREQLMESLRAAPQPRTVLDLADELGVHVNTVRFHLDALTRAGRVEQLIGPAKGPGRPPVLFRARRRMDPYGPTNYELLADVLVDHLATNTDEPARAANEVGRRWGSRLDRGRPVAPSPGRGRPTRAAALAGLTQLLDDLGFEPEPPEGSRDRAIRLRHCPFLKLVDDTRGAAVVCSLHLGLMQGVLESERAPVTVDRLQPFVEPDLCVAHLAPAGTEISTSAAPGGRRG